MSNTVTVEFPNCGPREVEPSSWEPDIFNPFNPGRLHPVFNIPGYHVNETVDGRFIAMEISQ